MAQRSVVLLDMDGVLVANVPFDSAVTDYIVQRLSSERNISLQSAEAEWNTELVESRGNPEWHNYDFHCRRLGLPDLAQEAHQESASLLLPILGAKQTLEFLRESDVIIGVVSDAMRWVVDFKLQALDLPMPDFVFTSDMGGGPKKTAEFWRSFRETQPADSLYIYVDNRIINLDSAAREITGVELHLVCFIADEHVLQLSGVLDAELERTVDAPVTVVADHYELADCVVEILVSGQPEWDPLPSER